MKKIILIASILFAQYSYSQTAQSKYENCLKSINEQETKANEDLVNKWYEDNPNPQKYVFLACDDHCPKYYCRRHHKQCISYCDCYKQYQSEGKSITDRYQTMRNACESTYQRELAEENAKAERERKAEEEKRKKEENERLEKERNEQEAKDKAEKEKSNLTDGKNNSDSSKSKSTSTYVDPKVLEMKARYDEQHRKDSIENVTMGAAAVATAGAMFAMGDKELNRKEEDYEIATYLKAVLGLGYNFLPAIENDIYNGIPMSISTTSGFPYIEASFQFAAFNNSFVSWKLSPYGYFGMNAFDAGTSGTHFCYGGSTSLGFGKKFKFLLQGEYLIRNGSMSIDDAVNFVDSKGTSNYSYSTLKYGAGIQLRIGEDVPTEYSLSVFREEVSFMKGEDKNKNVFSFQFKMSAKICSFFAEYSPDYPVAGDILYPATYDKDKQYLMRFGISVPLTLFSNY